MSEIDTDSIDAATALAVGLEQPPQESQADEPGHQHLINQCQPLRVRHRFASIVRTWRWTEKVTVGQLVQGDRAVQVSILL